MPKRTYPLATFERIRELLNYEPDTGILRWIVSRVGRGCVAGREAGTKRADGYIIVCIDGVGYYGHILAYVIMKGCWPDEEIDHHDKHPSNNKWGNLRAATHSQNLMNRRSNRNKAFPMKGVYEGRSGRWFAQIKRKGEKQVRLGTFDTPEEAQAAYIDAATRMHGAFASPI